MQEEMRTVWKLVAGAVWFGTMFHASGGNATYVNMSARTDSRHLLLNKNENNFNSTVHKQTSVASSKPNHSIALYPREVQHSVPFPRA